MKGENLNNQLKSKALLDTNTSNLITYCFLFYIFISLSIFVISENILDKSQICSNFVNFMKRFFPNIEIFENIYPFYVRQKFIPNKHHILFNELVFPSEAITTTLDISLEYRPNHDEENNRHASCIPYDVDLLCCDRRRNRST